MESDRNDCVAQSADVDRRRRRSSARRRMYPICILIFQSVSHLTRYIKIHRDTSRQDTFVSGTSVFIIASAILLRENMYIS